MEIEGKIIQVLEPKTGISAKTGNSWKKQEYVMETLGSYPRKVKFDFFGDRVDSNRLEIGKTYIVQFDLESREYNKNWYTDVRAYASRESAAPGFSAAPAADSAFMAPPAPVVGEPDPFGTPAPEQNADDLPF